MPELPRKINPENIEIGDTIMVMIPMHKGIRRSTTGTVAERQDQGRTRVYRTAEGGVVLSWEPGRLRPRVILLDRAPVAQTPIPGLWGGVPDERVS